MNLLKLLRDNAKKEISNLRIEAKDNAVDIYIYDVIDDYFGVSANEFNKELASLKGKQVNLRINSAGGDVFSGRAMATAIANHGNVIAYIDGLAASAATYVALAAKEVHIADGAMFMIHNAWSLAYGNKDDMRNTADLLEKIDGTIIADYVKKTNLEESEIKSMMDAETWFTAQEALDKGFVDVIFAGVEAKNSWDLSAYNNAPVIEQKIEEPITNHLREACERRLRILKSA
jgi:ATP-dependent Clp protease, protease subunit